MKFIGGLIAGALLVAFGVSLGKSRPRHRRFYARRRSGHNPGFRRRQFEREALLYIHEAREMIREIRGPRPEIDADFIVQPGTANASPTPEPNPAGGKS